MIRDGDLAASATRDHRRMDVNAVADDFGRHVIVLEHGAGQAGRAVADRRHAVEQMRGVARAGGDALERLLVGRAGMSERHSMSVAVERCESGRCAPSISGAIVTMPTSGRAAAISLEDRFAGELAFRPRSARADAGTRSVARLCIPD